MKAIKSKQGLKCYYCFSPSLFLAPLLVESGRGRPKDIICPICSRMFDSVTGNEYIKQPKVDPDNEVQKGWR